MKTTNLRLSADDLARLIDGLEGTTHQDTTEAEQDHTDDLLRRLVEAFQPLSREQLSLLP